MAQVQQQQQPKTYECFTCHQPIVLQRDQANQKWIKTNLDGTKHVDFRKPKKQQQEPTTQAATLENGPQLAELAKQVSDLKETVKVLISQIQMLRNEVKKPKCESCNSNNNNSIR